MEGQLISKSKWFWAWQDDREEAWLSEMARQGLHLRQASPFGQYTFVSGPPRAMAYRLDFITQSKKNSDYFQLFQDAGWEHVGEMSGWQYWRKEIVEGRVPEIFTDNASKIQKYQRLLGFLVIFLPINIIFLANYDNIIRTQDVGLFGILYEILFFLFFAVYMVYLSAVLMILRRITMLKQKP
jgi:hypothetical protein